MTNHLRKRQILDRLQVSESTFRRWVAEGRFPAPMKVNRILLWSETAVNDWLQSQQEAKT